ncbi:hypothetical protein AX15_003946 [Amanita polypyramis BW_CC]|nr:hypothetical protein AX15_003946 [Amanita polypyramis BW_CC]
MYTYPPLCLRIRVIILSCISFISFVWTIFLSFYIFCQWDVIRRAEQSIVVLFLLVNAMTVIMLLVLLIISFRTWLDAARCMFLLVSHIGVAAAIVSWKPQFQCMTTDQDKIRLCKYAGTYLLVISWAVPVLIVLYLQFLAVMVYRLRKLDAGFDGSGVVEVAGGEEHATPMRHNTLSIFGPHEALPNTTHNDQTMYPPSPVSSVPKAVNTARLSKPPRIYY